MLRVALIGLGKMGLSHFAILRAHPEIELVAICDSTAYMLDILGKYTGVHCYTDYGDLLKQERPDAVIIATPSRLHGNMIAEALEHDINVFCEKPFCLDLAEGENLAQLARHKDLVNQVGYHYRFVATFTEMKKLIEAGAIGQVHHLRAEAYGPVVLKPQGMSWRASKNEGGGCLYDYACHAIDLINYLGGPPAAVGGSVLNKIFSREVDDEVYANLFYANGKTAQIAANWSDDSVRKMTTKVTAWGKNGKIYADRQELQIYLRSNDNLALGLRQGWNTRHITDFPDPVWFYLRGEEYSLQIAHFIDAVRTRQAGQASAPTRSTFQSALETDRVLAMLQADAIGGHATEAAAHAIDDKRTPRWWQMLAGFPGR